MDENKVLNLAHPYERLALRSAPFEHERSQVELDPFHNKGLVLIVALLLSLGMWGAIWLAVSTLVARLAL